MTSWLACSEILTATEFQRTYDNTIYDGLAPWWQERDTQGNYVPMLARKPNVRMSLAKRICGRPAAFLMGERTFPQFSAPGDGPGVVELNDVMRTIREAIHPISVAACLHACIQGAAAITFGFVRGKLVLRAHPRTQAWPILDGAGELLALVSLFQGVDDQDAGKFSWYRMTLDAESEVWEKSSQLDGGWQLVRRIDHKFGFVPAVWIRHWGQYAPGVEGISMLDGVLDILRELDYTTSRRSRTLYYLADPQVVLQDKDPVKTDENLRKSPAGTWLLGPDGKAYYLEIGGEGVRLQGEFANDMRKAALEIAGVVLPEVEKITGAALSGFAMKITYEALINTGDQLKSAWTPALTELMQKIVTAAKKLVESGARVRIRGIEQAVAAVRPLPAETGTDPTRHPWIRDPRLFPIPSFAGDAVDIGLVWGTYFELSITEEKDVVTMVAAAKAAEIVSQESAVRKASTVLDVADPEEELRRIQVETGQDLPPDQPQPES